MLFDNVIGDTEIESFDNKRWAITLPPRNHNIKSATTPKAKVIHNQFIKLLPARLKVFIDKSFNCTDGHLIHYLLAIKCFSIPIGSLTLDTTQAQQSIKGIRGKPMFICLGLEIAHQ